MARITGNVQPTIALAEHDDTGGVNTKKALIYGWYPSGPTKVRVQVDADGVIQTSGSSGTQYADGAARGTATGTLMMVDDGTNIQSAAGTTGGLLKIDLSGTAVNTTAIKVDGSAVTQPVSGTFWQATQPVSGTFWQTTQPVSIASMPSTPVTGTFWQATQPVSGTFWQATQPISGTVTVTATNLDIRDLTATDIVTAVHGITGIGHGVKTVTTAGTDVVLAASTACKRVTIQAQTDNTTAVAVGTSGVDATVATGTGILLFPGDSFEMEIDNLADIYIDALTDGEGVRYVYFS